METQKIAIEPLFERVEEFGKTSLELLKLKSISKASDVFSEMLVRFLMIASFIFFLLIFSVGVSLFIGNLVGDNSFGFMIISLIYGFIYLVLLLFRKMIKRQVKQSIISQIHS
jgi:hypothetical protein